MGHWVRWKGTRHVAARDKLRDAWAAKRALQRARCLSEPDLPVAQVYDLPRTVARPAFNHAHPDPDGTGLESACNGWIPVLAALQAAASRMGLVTGDARALLVYPGTLTGNSAQGPLATLAGDVDAMREQAQARFRATFVVVDGYGNTQALVRLVPEVA